MFLHLLTQAYSIEQLKITCDLHKREFFTRKQCSSQARRLILNSIYYNNKFLIPVLNDDYLLKKCYINEIVIDVTKEYIEKIKDAEKLDIDENENGI